MLDLIKEVHFVTVAMMRHEARISRNQTIVNAVNNLLLSKKPFHSDLILQHHLISKELKHLPNSNEKTALITLGTSALDLFYLAHNLSTKNCVLPKEHNDNLEMALHKLNGALRVPGNIKKCLSNAESALKQFKTELLKLVDMKEKKEVKPQFKLPPIKPAPQQNNKVQVQLPKLNKVNQAPAKIPHSVKPVLFQPIKPIQHFGDVKKTHECQYHNVVTRVKKKPKGKVKRDNYIWFWKRTFDGNIINASCGLFCGELWRFFTNTHPKYRFGANDQKEQGVLSKGVPGFRSFFNMSGYELKTGIEQGRFTGLFETLIIAIFLGDNDRKFDNIGIDEQGRVISIDPDSTLGYLSYPGPNSNYLFDENDLENPLRLTTYRVYNWVDTYGGGVPYPTRVFNNSIILNPRIRQEINQAILKIFMVPPEFFDVFVQSYPLAGIKTKLPPESMYKNLGTIEIDRLLVRELKSRHQLFQRCVVKMDSFKEYLHSNEAARYFSIYKTHISQFKTMGKRTLVQYFADLPDIMQDNFDFARERMVRGYKP